ncbi:MAG TPA: TonB-dependent receptor [Flavisolibacter sp.]|nr:TonB-dependent receptor [Flavisolibacter sp.]
MTHSEKNKTAHTAFWPCRYRQGSRIWLLLFLIVLSGEWTVAQQKLAPAQLKKLSVEELMNIEVTLASRTPQKLTESASAIQVLTGEDIRRSGATNIPEALRLVPNVQVAQITASAWIISTRGFNTIFANKLLVMIDGRTVYTPLFGGVIWEQQNVVLEDVDRIEVVSGPGGTLWGANAVNGVINIVTKGARHTQGLYAMASAGTFIKDMAELRYGGKISEKLFYRVYGQHFDRKETTLPNGTDNTDAWLLTRGGFRLDWDPGVSDAVTLQGNIYDGKRKTTGGNSPLNGQNILGRWSHTISDKSDLSLQLYYDRYFREDIPGTGSDRLKTFDVDFQHRFPLPYQSLLWGAGYRVVNDEALFRTTNVGILPPQKTLHLFNGFVQDEITLHERVRLTIGTKLTHFTYSGFELQPSVRLAWNPRPQNTLWAAVSRAIRSPSRFDVDYYLPTYSVPPTSPSVAGGPNFISEKVTAYELGYRLQPNQRSTFSVATFYNVYHDLYSVEALPGTLTYQIQNGSEGNSWGAELSANYQVTDKWRWRGGYTYFDKDLSAKQGHTFNPDYLGNDVRHRAVLQSMLDLPLHLQLDIAARYLSGLPKTIATAAVPSYFTFDSRIAYTFRQFEVAVVGQNLWEDKHTEFGVLSLPRNVYAKISARF